MNFLDLVNQGVEKSNKALAAAAEVDGVYEKINADLKSFPAGKLTVQRKISTMAQISSFAAGISGGSNPESEYFKHDKVVLMLEADGFCFSEEVAGWKQRIAGYPCVLKFDGQELTCSNRDHLLSGMSELLSSVGFGNSVNKLIRGLNKGREAGRRVEQAAGVAAPGTLDVSSAKFSHVSCSGVLNVVPGMGAAVVAAQNIDAAAAAEVFRGVFENGVKLRPSGRPVLKARAGSAVVPKSPDDSVS